MARRCPAADAERRIDAVRPDDLSDLIFTSGTTGRPKGVMITHGQSVRVYDAWTDVIGLRAGDRYLIVNPFFHAFGYKAGWMSCILRGATIVPCKVFEVPKVLEMVAQERITVLPGPPTLLQGILDFPDRATYDLSSLRLTVTGAAAVPVKLVERLRDEMTFETIITGYGLTESTGHDRDVPSRRRSRDHRELVGPRDPRHGAAHRRRRRPRAAARASPVRSSPAATT